MICFTSNNRTFSAIKNTRECEIFITYRSRWFYGLCLGRWWLANWREFWHLYQIGGESTLQTNSHCFIRRLRVACHEASTVSRWCRVTLCILRCCRLWIRRSQCLQMAGEGVFKSHCTAPSSSGQLEGKGVWLSRVRLSFRMRVCRGGGEGGSGSEDGGIAEYWWGEKSKILTERFLLPSSCLEQWPMGQSTLLQRRKVSSGVCMGRLRPCCLAFSGLMAQRRRERK